MTSVSLLRSSWSYLALAGNGGLEMDWLLDRRLAVSIRELNLIGLYKTNTRLNYYLPQIIPLINIWKGLSFSSSYLIPGHRTYWMVVIVVLQ